MPVLAGGTAAHRAVLRRCIGAFMAEMDTPTWWQVVTAGCSLHDKATAF